MHYSLQTKKGMTLIEVLIALAIISIALTAIIHSASQNIRATLYLQNKNIAAWVGTDIINEIRVGTIKISGTPEGKASMLGQEWKWKANFTDTPNPQVKQVNVAVYEETVPQPLIQLVSYVYAEK